MAVKRKQSRHPAEYNILSTRLHINVTTQNGLIASTQNCGMFLQANIYILKKLQTPIEIENIDLTSVYIYIFLISKDEKNKQMEKKCKYYFG